MNDAIFMSDELTLLQNKLNHHPIYKSLKTLRHLRCFMEHHVYSVWDFMSLIKYLQSVICPSHYPWKSKANPELRRFINELVLEEESDQDFVEGKYTSHFDLYIRAMEEVEAETGQCLNFVDQVNSLGINKSLSDIKIPEPSRSFSKNTFKFIEADKPHEIAALLAFGREKIIPEIFRSILKDIGIKQEDAPIFYYYLRRHIHLDQDFHGPLSMKLLNDLCEGDPIKMREAERASIKAIEVRIKFWDEVYDKIIL